MKQFSITKHISILLILCTILLTAACNNDETKTDTPQKASEKTEKQSYTVPSTEIAYYDNLENKLYEKFYFIGWSKDGKIAYVTEPADEATGYYFFNFVIFDTKQNKQTFFWSIDEEDEVEGAKLSDVWANNKELFETELKKAEISPQKANLQKFPFTFKGKNYTLEENISYQKNEYFMLEVVKKANLKLKADDKPINVFSKDYDSQSTILNTKATYCILSPFTDDAILLIQEERIGYEGPPNLLLFQIASFKLSE